nr:hypothetical protein [Tanacetum cinerariifolium]
AKINKNLMRVLQVNQQFKAVTPNCETCSGSQSFNDCPATVRNTQNVYAARAYQGTLSGNIITTPKENMKGITTRSRTAYQGPTSPTTSSLPPVVERETEATKDTMHPTNNGSTEDVQPLDLNFNISFTDALIIMPKFSPAIKTLLTNKDKLSELARMPLNEHCSVVLLKKLPEKLGDPGNDFLLEEVDAFLAFKDDPTSPEVDQSYVDTEGDILLLEAFLNDDRSLPPPNQGNYLPQLQKELKICEAKINKSLIDEPLKVELKDLPPHLEYAFYEGDDKLPVIIVKYLSVEEKTALITVLKSHK